MKRLVLSFIMTFALLFLQRQVSAQTNIGVKAFAVGAHPFEEANKVLNMNAIDEKGNFALEPGFYLSLEQYVSDDMVALKMHQSIHRDRLNKLAGSTHVGVQVYLYRDKRQSLSFGLGPTLYFRGNWSEVEGYEFDDFYETNQEWQYKLQFITGELQYNYYLGKHLDFAVSLNQFEARGLTLAVGANYWLTSKPRRKNNCNCPSFK